MKALVCVWIFGIVSWAVAVARAKPPGSTNEINNAECSVECRYEVEGSIRGSGDYETCYCVVPIAHLHEPVKTRASDHEGKSYNSLPDERKPLKYEAD